MHSFPATPTLDRIAAVQVESQAIGEFLEWLKGHYALCVITDDGYAPTYESETALLQKYFEIDGVAEENERRAVLEFHRKQNA